MPVTFHIPGVLREFTAGLADLERVSGEMRERRILLRASATADLTNTEAPAGQLLAMAPSYVYSTAACATFVKKIKAKAI